jgi:predicted nucleic acid-binding Zn ribbon protein
VKKRPRHSNLQNASNVLQALLGNGKSALSDGFLRWKIWRNWEQVVGPSLAHACEPVGYRHGLLYLWVKSSAHLQELRFFQSEIREKVNKHVGREWVRSLRITTNRHDVDPNAINTDYLDREDSERD